MLEEVLPPTVASAHAFKDQPGDEIFPAEAAVISRAVDKRRREFATVRTCARRALATLGLEPHPILPDADGAPSWPRGVVGSMTHCDGYRAAAVAWSSQIACIGIDAEPQGHLPDGVLGVVATADEREGLVELAERDSSRCWDRLLFSAKESLYKAWFPLTRTWLGFDDVRVIIDPDAGTFVGRLLVTGPLVDGNRIYEFPGRWAMGNGLVLTAVVVDGNSRVAGEP
jgi:4'-phosphopantetheinyl transferase EntD